MRIDIDATINTPGPVTFLKKETDFPVDDVVKILRETIKSNRAGLNKEGILHPDWKVKFLPENHGSCFVIIPGNDPNKKPVLAIHSTTNLIDPLSCQDEFLAAALYAVENYEKHPLYEDLDTASLGAMLLEEFFAEHPEIDSFEEAKSVRLKSLFNDACIWTHNTARFRAAPQWSRAFTLVTTPVNLVSNWPIIHLDPIEMNEPYPLEKPDPVSRMWAAARTELFKFEPKSVA